MTTQKYLNIVSHYESCLEKHGDTHLGVDWPNQADALTRYRVMLEVVRAQAPTRVSLLDFGCGASHLYDYILENGIRDIDYSGLDISEKFVQLSRQKYPQTHYYCTDILKESSGLPQFDYIVMNGVFTEKRELSHDEMWEYFRQMILKTFERTRAGLAFNVMSAHVDWEREDLFHLPIDKLTGFLVKEVSRDFVIRHDYKLYEYTTYVYRR
ncbi:MAG TPA: class I SAM-dependent methyltransferase [Anaerolineales bacterium]|nr:class I SAM-dependent methyltransferase [Anaerolineales bacterium]